jgi:hypothetical protein
MRRGRMTKTDWAEVEVDVTIDSTDVIDFIEDYANESDLKEIRKSLSLTSPLPTGTMVDVMKIELFRKASEKYTLEELEELLKLQYN